MLDAAISTRLRAARLRVLWCAILLLCGCGTATALDPQAPLGGFAKQVWSVENGLPQSSVHQILQTADGFLWLGTEGGLARFDGFQFKVFDRENLPGLAGDDLRCLLEDRGGVLWVGTGSGLTRLKDGRARAFTEADGVAPGPVSAMMHSTDGRLWVVSAGGLAVSAGNASGVGFRGISQGDGLLSSTVLALAPDADGGVWVGTSLGLNHIVGTNVQRGPPGTLGAAIVALARVPGGGGSLLVATQDGVMRLQGGSMSVLAKGEALPVGGVRQLVTTGEGVWLVGRSSVTLIRPGGTLSYATGTSLPGTQITTVTADRQGAVWIGTNGGSARFWNGTMEVLTGAGESDLASVLTIVEDHDGDMWIGTETAGVKVLRPRAFALLAGSVAGGDAATTSVLQAADGSVWTGTSGAGVIRSGGTQAARAYTTSDGLASNTVLTLGTAEHDDLWVGTPDGLSVLHAGHWQTITSADGLGDDLVRSVLPTKDGAVWVGTRHGVTRWKDSRGTTLTTAQGLGSDLIGPMLQEASGDLWIGTSGGLSRMHQGVLHNYTVADGLPSNIITTLEPAASGGIWIGTNDQGLARWDGAKFLSFAKAREVPREIHGLLEDGTGSLWMSSEHGIYRVSIASLDKLNSDPASEVEVSSYGTADGLPAVETAGAGYPSAWRLTDGRLAFASRRGVVVIDPVRLKQDDAPPLVVLEQITVDDKTALPEEISALTPGPAQFSFSFAGINLAAPQRVQYRYMLEGLDHQWIAAGTRRVAYYTNIPHGHYRFLVCARNGGGVWSQPVIASFEIRPWFYQTIWFRVLVALLLVALGLGFYGVRVRTLRKRFDAVAAERNRLAREIHDTLAQSFVAVSVRLEVMSQMLGMMGGVEKTREQLNQARTLVRESLEEARRSIWDLRSEGAGAQSLPARLARLVRETTQRLADTRLETTGTYRALAQPVEDELYRIAQEAVANAVRHAHAQSIQLRLRYELERVSLAVIDDGRGFDVAAAPSRESGHFGLTGMRERARILGADVMLESGPGKGTIVAVSVPLLGK